MNDEFYLVLAGVGIYKLRKSLVLFQKDVQPFSSINRGRQGSGFEGGRKLAKTQCPEYGITGGRGKE